jgi:hypothetical protein
MVPMLLCGECYENKVLNDGYLYAFKCKRFRNTRNTVIFGTIVKLFLKHPALPVFFNLIIAFLQSTQDT